jgi:hypothetical protein
MTSEAKTVPLSTPEALLRGPAPERGRVARTSSSAQTYPQANAGWIDDPRSTGIQATPITLR